MKKFLFMLGLLFSFVAMASTLHDFKYVGINGEDVFFSSYKGKVILLVNTASECGFTGQYDGLEKLYKEYKDKGLVIIGFPSNQFGGQEPGTDKQIEKFCKLRFGVSFPLGRKIEVNGDNAEGFYKFLKEQKLSGLDGDIRWNFEKFLIDKNGQPVARFRSMVEPSDEKLVNQIKSLLAL